MIAILQIVNRILKRAYGYNVPMPYLMLARHDESELNAGERFSGIADSPLTPHGRIMAARLAHLITGLKPDVAYTSRLSRARDTLAIMLQENGWSVPVHAAAELNERDSGKFTGLSLQAVEQELGHSKFEELHYGWNVAIPDGETHKAVYARVVPYFKRRLLPELEAGRTVLVVAHDHSLRALIKYLDGLSDRAIQDLRMPHDQIILYHYDDHGHITAKQIRRLPG